MPCLQKLSGNNGAKRPVIFAGKRWRRACIETCITHHMYQGWRGGYGYINTKFILFFHKLNGLGGDMKIDDVGEIVWGVVFSAVILPTLFVGLILLGEIFY